MKLVIDCATNEKYAVAESFQDLLENLPLPKEFNTNNFHVRLPEGSFENPHEFEAFKKFFGVEGAFKDFYGDRDPDQPDPPVEFDNIVEDEKYNCYLVCYDPRMQGKLF